MKKRTKRPTHSNRTPSRWLFFTYGMMTVATFAAAGILLFFTLGFRFDRDNLRFERGGLIQVATTPASSRTTINNQAGQQAAQFTNPGKGALLAGTYNVSITRDGYKQWSSQSPLASGQLLWLNYIRLFPDTITTTKVHQFESVAAAQPSPDYSRFAVLPSKERATLLFVNVQTPTRPTVTTIDIPAEDLTVQEGTPSVFELLEWDVDSRYMLVRHTNGSTVEYLRVDRTDAASTINISRELGLQLKEVHFSGNDENVLYALDQDILRRINLSDNSISGTLLTGVRSYSVFAGSATVAYVRSVAATADEPAHTQVGIVRDNVDIPVNQYPEADIPQVRYGEYYNHDYLAISHGAKLDIIRDPAARKDKTNNQPYETVTLADPSDWLYFSPTSRIIVSQHADKVTSHDLETSRTYTFSLGTQSNNPAQHQWLDEFHLYSTSSGQLVVTEFDGNYRQTVSTVATGSLVTLSENQEYIISLAPTTPDSPLAHLQASQIQP